MNNIFGVHSLSKIRKLNITDYNKNLIIIKANIVNRTESVLLFNKLFISLNFYREYDRESPKKKKMYTIVLNL